MKTASEILIDNDNSYGSGLDYGDCISAMKEYARQVVEQALKDSCLNATYSRIIDWSVSYERYQVDPHSIMKTEIITP